MLGASRLQRRLFFRYGLPLLAALGLRQKFVLQVQRGVAHLRVEYPVPLRDKASYFVVIVQRERGVVVTEHYDYDNALSGVVEGRDARSIYWTVIENTWVSELSHAAHLGKELAKAELALQTGAKYVQDGA